MTYLPKSQIKSNVYTKGKELYYISNRNEYKGYYYITSQNQYFTGKHPGDFPNTELIKLDLEGAEDFNPDVVPNIISTSWVYMGSGYNKSFPSPPSLPLSSHPSPQKKDYELGEFERYFLSKTTHMKFIEVNKELYNKYVNQSPDVSYQLYFPFSINWELVGEKDKVYEVNLKNVKQIELNLQLRGFTQYFKGRFTQFYQMEGPKTY